MPLLVLPRAPDTGRIYNKIMLHPHLRPVAQVINLGVKFYLLSLAWKAPPDLAQAPPNSIEFTSTQGSEGLTLHMPGQCQGRGSRNGKTWALSSWENSKKYSATSAMELEYREGEKQMKKLVLPGGGRQRAAC